MDKLRPLAIVLIALAVMSMAVPAFGLVSSSVAQIGADTGHDALASESAQNSPQQAAIQNHNINYQQQSHSQNQSDSQSAADIVRNARQSLKNIEDVKATLDITTEISNETTTIASNSAKVRLWFERPNKFRLEILEPEAQAGTVIVSNGTAVTLSSPQTDTVFSIDISKLREAGAMEMKTGTMKTGALSKRAAGSFGQIQSMFTQSDIAYEGTATVAGHETYVLSFTAENASTKLSIDTTIYLDQQSYLPVKIVSETTTTLQNETITITSTILVHDLQVNTGIPDSVFEIEAPSDGDGDDTEAPSDEEGDDTEAPSDDKEQPAEDGADEAAPDQPAEEGDVYYQVDFVATDPIKQLRGPEGTYADSQLVRFVHGSTDKPVMRRAPGVLAYAENTELNERVESQEITIENGTATITFTVAEGSEPVELSLVSYTKPGSGWSPEIEHLQEFVDAETGTFEAGTYTLTVELPGSDANTTSSSE